MVGFGRPNSTLIGAIPQLNQIAIVESDGWDVALGSGIDNAGCAGADAQAIDHLCEVGNDLLDRIGPVFDGRHDQVSGSLKRCAANSFVAGADDHLVDAPRTGFACFAKTSLHACSVLQFQSHVFHDVTRPSAFSQSLKKAASLAYAATMLDQAGQHFLQPLVKAGKGVGGAVF